MGGITNKQTFVGFDNFKDLFGDKSFLQAMQNSILIIVIVTLCTVFLAVLFATLLQRGKFIGQNFFRVIFYIPNILSIVVIAGIFGAIYDPSSGLLNTFLRWSCIWQVWRRFHLTFMRQLLWMVHLRFVCFFRLPCLLFGQASELHLPSTSSVPST